MDNLKDSSIDHLVSQINDIAVAAGQEILEIYQRDFKVDMKEWLCTVFWGYSKLIQKKIS